MKKIFLLVIMMCFVACDNAKDEYVPTCCQLGPIANFHIRLVDTQGNWIVGIEEKEMKLLVADSEWNILEEQPDNTPGVFHALSLWNIEKIYKHCNLTKNEEEEEFCIWEELISLEITTFFKYFNLYKNNNNNETYGDYIVLQIDDNRYINIQLKYVEKENHVSSSIDKFICNGVEYDNEKGEIADIIIE